MRADSLRHHHNKRAIAPSDKRVVQTLLWALKPLKQFAPLDAAAFSVTGTHVSTNDDSRAFVINAHETTVRFYGSFVLFFSYLLVGTLQIPSRANNNKYGCEN